MNRRAAGWLAMGVAWVASWCAAAVAASAVIR
jgi:hypothetical protein